MEQLIRNTIPYILAAFFPLVTAAQSDSYFKPERHDVGLAGGAAFYLGDLSTDYALFRNFSFFAGPMYRYNFNELYSLRGQIAIGELTGAMHRTDMPPDNNKNPWDFKRSMILMELTGEAGFLPIDVVDFRKQQRWSPYLIGGMGFGVLAPDKLLDIDEDMQTFCGYILLGIGVKVALWERLTLGLEWVMRKTFSDNLDYYAGRPGSL